MSNNFFLMSIIILNMVFISTARSQTKNMPAPIAPEVRFVAAGVQNAREQFRRAQAVITYHSKRPKLYFERQRAIALNPHVRLPPSLRERLLKAPTDPRETTSTSLFYYEAPNIFIEKQTDPKVAINIRSESVVIDANRAYVLELYDEKEGQSKQSNDKSGYYSFGYIRPRNEMLENGLVKYAKLSDPRYYSYFDHLGGEPLDQRFLRADFLPTYQGEEVLNGSRCMKIEVSFLQDAKILYWIDVEHSFLLRRREERVNVGNEYLLSLETIVPQVQESNGIWLPTTVETREFLDPVKAEPGKSPEVDPSKVVFSRTTISDFKANIDIPTNTFVMKWPIGTNVKNQITQDKFVAGEDNNQKTQSKEKKADAKKTGQER